MASGVEDVFLGATEPGREGRSAVKEAMTGTHRRLMRIPISWRKKSHPELVEATICASKMHREAGVPGSTPSLGSAGCLGHHRHGWSHRRRKMEPEAPWMGPSPPHALLCPPWPRPPQDGATIAVDVRLTLARRSFGHPCHARRHLHARHQRHDGHAPPPPRRPRLPRASTPRQESHQWCRCGSVHARPGWAKVVMPLKAHVRAPGCTRGERDSGRLTFPGLGLQPRKHQEAGSHRVPACTHTQHTFTYTGATRGPRCLGSWWHQGRKRVAD